MTSAAFTQLANGSIFQAVNTLYFGVMDAWWIIILFVFTLFAVQITTKEEGATAVIGIFGSAFLLRYAPTGMPVSIHAVIYLILVLSVAMLLYRLSGKGE